ncbi:MAG: rhodanese-related sulfurtransferase [Xanthobacteraceae bacterium]
MSIAVAALYQFLPLPDFRDLREPLRLLCERLQIKGSLLLAEEGLNGTVAGRTEAIAAFVDQLNRAVFAGRLDDLELKLSRAAEMPFRRLKVRLKKEIVTLGDAAVDPTREVGTYVAAEDWNALLTAPDLLLIDTRNAFEVAMGTFDGALDPRISRFSEFRNFVQRTLDPTRHKRVAMFCTGGIRCEKASSYLLARGFAEVYHLKGGILNYLEKIPQTESRWRGHCFVFDDRIALDHGLVERRPAGSGAGAGGERLEGACRPDE